MSATRTLKGLGPVERARRTCLIFLRQTETEIRQIAQYGQRVPAAPGEPPVDQAVEEGWALLKSHAEQMATAGYDLHETNRIGSRYILGEPKPSISALVDAVVTALLDKRESISTACTRPLLTSKVQA